MECVDEKCLYIFTDGSCIGNNITNNINAVGSYGFYIPKNINNNTNYIKEVCFVTIAEAKKYIYESPTNNLLSNTDEKIRITNNRTELLAIIKSLIFIINNKIQYNYNKIIWVIDSKYAIRQFNNENKSHSNLDLTKILNQLKNEIIKKVNIEIVHQPSHVLKKDKINMNKHQLELIKGNELVDNMCYNLIKKK